MATLPTGATALTAAQSGTIFRINLTATAVTLPAVATSAGCFFRFINSVAAPAADCSITGPAGTLEGYLISQATRVACVGGSQITLAHAAMSIGDSIDLVCDGTNWMVRGFAQTAAAYTVV